MEPIKVDVITIPAYNLNSSTTMRPFTDLSDYEWTTKDKIRLMFTMALDSQVENLVLGAWVVEFSKMIQIRFLKCF
jgi:hypothetical protein